MIFMGVRRRQWAPDIAVSVSNYSERGTLMTERDQWGGGVVHISPWQVFSSHSSNPSLLGLRRRKDKLDPWKKGKNTKHKKDECKGKFLLCPVAMT